MELFGIIQITYLDIQLTVQLLLSFMLGSILGLEREHLGKAAGTRTFALVAVGSTLFTAISIYGFSEFSVPGSVDVSRIAASIVTGIGFLGMGLIVHNGVRVSGLTTAAGLWVAAAIGMAIGVQLYIVAVVTTVFTFFIFSLIRMLNIEAKVAVRTERQESVYSKRHKLVSKKR